MMAKTLSQLNRIRQIVIFSQALSCLCKLLNVTSHCFSFTVQLWICCCYKIISVHSRLEISGRKLKHEECILKMFSHELPPYYKEIIVQKKLNFIFTHIHLFKIYFLLQTLVTNQRKFKALVAYIHSQICKS